MCPISAEGKAEKSRNQKQWVKIRKKGEREVAQNEPEGYEAEDERDIKQLALRIES